MISLAVFLHGLALYLIQASAEPPKRKPTEAARLGILDRNRPSDLTVLTWIENRDPASVAGGSEPPQPPGVLLGVAYQPGFEVNLPQPLPAETEISQVTSPTLFPPGPVPEPTRKLEKHDVKPSALPTRILTSESLKIAERPSLIPSKIIGELPTPTQFFVVSSSLSGRNFYFLTQSSGDEKLDDSARTWLLRSTVTFVEGKSSGWVTLHWGREVWNPASP